MKKQPEPTVLSVVMLPPEHRSYRPSVCVEGDKKSLRWLATLILEIANGDDCGRGFDPDSALFTAYSELGLYFHRLPCMHGQLGGTDMSAEKVALANIRRQKKKLAVAKKKTTQRKRASRAG